MSDLFGGDGRPEIFVGTPDGDYAAATEDPDDPQIEALLGCLTGEPRNVDVVIDMLSARVSWLPEKRGTRIRLVRKILERAERIGYPVMSTTLGYQVATTPEDFDRAARRCEASAAGHAARGARLRARAQQMRLERNRAEAETW